MLTHFIEATNAGFNHGKFMLGRLTAEDAATRSALPGYEHESLWTLGGRRTLNPATTLVMDLQTGEGAAFTLEGGRIGAHHELEKHKIWVCPMFPHFLGWLYSLDPYPHDITALPRFVDIPEAEGAIFGYRRGGE